MNSTSPQANPIERYQDYRTRRFFAMEEKWSTMLPGWRTRRRRRILVTGLAITFVFMFAVGVVCAFGVDWAPLLWLPACLAFFPLWTTLQVVTGRQGDAPIDTLDEWEVAQRNAARSVGLAVTQWLVMIPVLYLIVGAVITGGTDESMAYAGGLMTLTTLLIGGCTPGMILGWTRPDPEPEDGA
jgi:peptidoglycan/LPS O-acetylase OafA/YrhL